MLAKKKVIKKFLEEMSRTRKTGFSTPKQEILKSFPLISKNSPKYADHPPNAGHGFAALMGDGGSGIGRLPAARGES